MAKAQYVDGFVISIPKKNKAKYKKLAKEGMEAWMKFGALDYKECRLVDDRSSEGVKFTFPKMAKAKEDEEVWFSFITYESKKHRNEVNKKVMAYFDEKYKDKNMDMPFDMKRLSTGGFSVEVGM